MFSSIQSHSLNALLLFTLQVNCSQCKYNGSDGGTTLLLISYKQYFQKCHTFLFVKMMFFLNNFLHKVHVSTN